MRTVLIVLLVIILIGAAAFWFLFLSGPRRPPKPAAVEAALQVAQEAAKTAQSQGAAAAAEALAQDKSVETAQANSDGSAVTVRFRNKLVCQIMAGAAFASGSPVALPPDPALVVDAELPKEPAPNHKGVLMIDAIAPQARAANCPSPAEVMQWVLADNRINVDVSRGSSIGLDTWMEMCDHEMIVCAVQVSADAFTDELVVDSGAALDTDTGGWGDEVKALYRGGALDACIDASGQATWLLRPGFLEQLTWRDNVVIAFAEHATRNDSLGGAIKAGNGDAIVGFSGEASWSAANLAALELARGIVSEGTLSDSLAHVPEAVGLKAQPSTSFVNDRIYGQRLASTQEMWDDVHARFRRPVAMTRLESVVGELSPVDVEYQVRNLAALGGEWSELGVPGLARMALDGEDFRDHFYAGGTEAILSARDVGKQEQLQRDLFATRVGLETLATVSRTPALAGKMASAQPVQDLLAGKQPEVKKKAKPKKAAPAKAAARPAAGPMGMPGMGTSAPMMGPGTGSGPMMGPGGAGPGQRPVGGGAGPMPMTGDDEMGAGEDD